MLVISEIWPYLRVWSSVKYQTFRLSFLRLEHLHFEDIRKFDCGAGCLQHRWNQEPCRPGRLCPYERTAHSWTQRIYDPWSTGVSRRTRILLLSLSYPERLPNQLLHGLESRNWEYPLSISDCGWTDPANSKIPFRHSAWTCRICFFPKFVVSPSRVARDRRRVCWFQIVLKYHLAKTNRKSSNIQPYA